MFWEPPIALHAGLRSEEILQLATAAIRNVDGIPCFVLQRGAGHSLKSFAARRSVSVRPNLTTLGLPELVALRRRQGEPRLFPWLESSAAKMTFAETSSKKFTTPQSVVPSRRTRGSRRRTVHARRSRLPSGRS